MTRKNLQSIMNLAWRFVREFNMSMSDALKTAWKNAKLYRALASSVVTFEYRKVDGSLRRSTGTISPNHIPSGNIPNGIHPYAKNSNRQAYFDFDKNEWRSYKRENLITIVC